MSLGKRKRFAILERDGFQCRYCGAKPPLTSLEVDHVVPLRVGGSNRPDNLVAACYDCNRGKSAHELMRPEDHMPEMDLSGRRGSGMVHVKAALVSWVDMFDAHLERR